MQLNRSLTAFSSSSIPQRTNHYVVNVTTIQGLAIAADLSPQSYAPMRPFRTSLTFHNPGTQDVYIAPATDAFGNAIALTVGVGYRVPAGGGTFTFDVPGPVQWNCIAQAAAVLTVLEYIS